MSDVPLKPDNPKQSGRIPLRRFELREGENIAIPGGHSISSICDCSPQASPGRAYFVAHFVPAHQVIELEWYRNEKTEPIRKRVVMSVVRTMD